MKYGLSLLVVLSSSILACSSIADKSTSSANTAKVVYQFKRKTPCQQAQNNLLDSAEQLSWQEAESALNTELGKHLVVGPSSNYQFIPHVVDKEVIRARLKINNVLLWPNQLIVRSGDHSLPSHTRRLMTNIAWQTAPSFKLSSQDVESISQKRVSDLPLIDHCKIYWLDKKQILTAGWLVNYSKGLKGYSVWIDDNAERVWKVLNLHKN